MKKENDMSSSFRPYSKYHKQLKAVKQEEKKMKTSAARAVYAIKYIEDGETKEAEVQFSTLEDTLSSYMARVHPNATLVSRELV
jgi:hypothetical protein